MGKHIGIFHLVVVLLLNALCAQAGNDSAKKELLIFCGITMIDPVKELMDLYHKESGVRASMSYGGSADLMKSVMINEIGDIYFPGTDSFVAEAERHGIVVDKRQVGSNQAALFVQKGNPKNLTGNLDELTDPTIQVAIGHPDLGSVGKEAKVILEAKGIYDKVVANAAMMQPDSKALSSLILDGKVDVVLNWRAAYFLQDNRTRMDMVPIAGEWARTHALTMTVVRYSKHRAEAIAFLELCASQKGREIFAKFGF